MSRQASGKIMRKHEYSDDLPPPPPSAPRRRERQTAGTGGGTSKTGSGTSSSSSTASANRPSTSTNANPGSYSYRSDKVKAGSSKLPKSQSKVVEPSSSASASDRVDVSKLTHDLTKMIMHPTSSNFVVKRPMIDSHHHGHKSDGGTASGSHHGAHVSGSSSSKKSAPSMNDNQTFQIKKILAECLQSFEGSEESMSRRSSSLAEAGRKHGHVSALHHHHHHVGLKSSENLPFAPVSTSDSLGKTSLLRSYLSGSNPTREEYVSKKKNVPNSLISSDSVHHSIFLESGRERRQCLLQYLSNVVTDGQVVIYANSIPGVESLMNFLTKHGFHVNAVHPRMLMAESNWILSEFSMKKFSVLLCAEDHYHSCPAHFRWVKTIINYELPICNPLENWSIRNGIVEFSDNLPVHIYTFIKKTCPLDNELVKLLHLDSVDHEDDSMIHSMTEQVYSL